jgi:hypothetical protein
MTLEPGTQGIVSAATSFTFFRSMLLPTNLHHGIGLIMQRELCKDVRRYLPTSPLGPTYLRCENLRRLGSLHSKPS